MNAYAGRSSVTNLLDEYMKLTLCLGAGYNPERAPTLGEDVLEPDQIARMVVDVASEQQALDIVMLDIQRVAGFADYFVIMSTESARQLEALQEDIVKALKESGVRPHHTEGNAKGGWVLLDYSDVIIHVFAAEQRTYYDLERLWSGAAQVVRVL